VPNINKYPTCREYVKTLKVASSHLGNVTDFSSVYFACWRRREKL
jgi:hypothetical protein